MAAITAAEKGLASVLLLEANSSPLDKVRISGGGRCNVTNACWEPNNLILNYPRGSRSLLGPFNKFASGDVVSWFYERGVSLITENDGRMFPSSNSSEEIISCLKTSAKKSGVNLQTKLLVKEIKFLEKNKFIIECNQDSSFYAKTVLLATGSHPSGRKIAKKLGHQIVSPVPSLFSFKLNNKEIIKCSGNALDNVDLKLITTEKTFYERGRILITHWGLSGPALLRLSSFAAINLFNDKYKARLIVNWINMDCAQAKALLEKNRSTLASKSLKTVNPFLNIPKKLWVFFLGELCINPSTRWSDLASRDANKLISLLTASEYLVTGKGPFKDEFVTAGGIDLNDIDLSTMESKIVKGLYFAGELLDVDGITGGFNFQHCWTSGWLAGLALSKKT